MDLFTFLLLLLKASFLSTGGTGNLPILYADMVPPGWASERQFAEALAIGQVTPGPTGLWVISFGYLVRSLPGGLLATLAITLPPFVVLGILWVYNRIERHPAVRGFVRGLGLAVIGISLVTLLDILRSSGVDPRSLLIAGAALALALTNRVPVIAILGLAAIVGILIY